MFEPRTKGRKNRQENESSSRVEVHKARDCLQEMPEAFCSPKFELRSRIGICAPCQDLLIAKENEGKKCYSEPSPESRERITPRFMENQWCSDSDWKKMRRSQYSDMKKRQRDG